MGGLCSPHGRDENAYNILDGKPEWTRPLGRTNRRWELLLEWILVKYGGIQGFMCMCAQVSCTMVSN
jgi:hypothetical protein